VEANGLANLAGLQAGDVLLQYNGADLNSAAELKIIPAEAGVRRIPVHFWRHGEIRKTEVAAGKLGIQIDPRRTAAQVVLAQRSAEDVLKPLSRGESWGRLEGSRHEVETIARLFPPGQATTLLGEQATESAFQKLAAGGQLKSYRFLHFATHGQADPTIAMNSALFLAPDPDRSAAPLALETDGRITAGQIVNTWDLDADLVVLSACQTGLGRYAGGEGYLGFAQALFTKGARTMVLSLWEVEDRPTQLLMERFYQNLLGKRADLTGPMPKAAALAEAKQWLRNLTSVELASLRRSDPRERPNKATIPAPVHRNYEHPYYWAGFILIGDPN
jgi:CHAT domain-containing protein